MIDDVDQYFIDGCGRCDRFASEACSARRWGDGIAALRTLCRASGLTETLKWSQPVYMHAGRNIAIIGALQGDFRLGFFNAALMTDPEGILEKQGPNTQHADALRFTSADAVTRRAPIISAYLREAMGYAEAGIKPAKTAPPVELPDELVDALDADSVLADAFHALTPGRQRSHVIAVTSAKQTQTRLRRIAKLRPLILAGKGAKER